MESIEILNKRLLDHYGKDINTDQAKYRIVWTSDQFEKRHGRYAVYDDNGTKIREEDAIEHQVPKYGYEFENMWVLERMMPAAGNPYLEGIVNYSYEPLWIFGAANSDRQPIWIAVRRLVENSINGDPNGRTKSPQELAREEHEYLNCLDEGAQKEKQLFKEMLANESPIISSLVRAGSGVYLDHDNFKKE